nr:sulfotransferase family 2 domain-containing protein [Octadecabacter algicola]
MGKRTLIHLHIPKTAGTSLTAILAGGFPDGTHQPIYSEYFDKPDQQVREELHDKQFMFGHVQHGVARQLEQDHLYICTLRSPGPRLLSYYNYVRRTESHYCHKAVAGQNMSFGTFLKWASKRGNPFKFEVDNGQVRLLAGQNRQNREKIDTDILHTAVSNLLSQDMIYGLTEYFDDFVRVLVEKGIVAVDINIQRNVSPNSANFEDELKNLTRSQKKIYDAFTYWDEIMYDLAKKSYFLAHN